MRLLRTDHLRVSALITTVFVADSRAYRASAPLPFMVVVPHRRSLRLARNTRVERPTVVKQEPHPAQGVRYAVRVPDVHSIF